MRLGCTGASPSTQTLGTYSWGVRSPHPTRQQTTGLRSPAHFNGFLPISRPRHHLSQVTTERRRREGGREGLGPGPWSRREGQVVGAPENRGGAKLASGVLVTCHLSALWQTHPSVSPLSEQEDERTKEMESFVGEAPVNAQSARSRGPAIQGAPRAGPGGRGGEALG